MNILPFFEINFGDLAVHLRPHLHCLVRLDVADGRQLHWNVALLNCGDHNRRRRAFACSSARPCCCGRALLAAAGAQSTDRCQRADKNAYKWEASLVIADVHCREWLVNSSNTSRYL